MKNSRSKEFQKWILAEIARLPPNSCLPPDRELAKQWDLSAITIQRTLSKLREQDKIVRIPGKGTFTPGLEKPGSKPLEVKANVPRESSVEHLVAGLVRLISEGVYRRGSALPAINFIRNQFKVSSETVTAAYQLLEKSGYVEKIGKSYWVGQLENLMTPRPRKEVFFFRFGAGDFRDILEAGPVSLAFQKMERELYGYGYYLLPENVERMDALAREWETEQRWPAGLVFHAVTPEHIPLFQRFFDEHPGLNKNRVRILVYGEKGDLSPLTRHAQVLSRGNVHTSLARMTAHYLLAQGHREAVFCFDESELTGTTPFHFFFKIALTIKSVVPGFIFRTVVQSRPGSTLNRTFLRAIGPEYQQYLRSKYPNVDLKSLEEHLVISEKAIEACAEYPSAKIWLFSTDEKAAAALQWLRNRGSAGPRVPQDVGLVGFQNDPRYYHLGLSTCGADWDQMGYMMAHSLIGDVKLAHSGRGFLKVNCQLVDKLTTLPMTRTLTVK
ncbi:MAG TPA: hypothetical protein DCQ83_07440 [Fibrobacteres bacterium]|jgi:DNA-binding transcriptional regulator YhcF (GntR family)|nr:hypothetical protein [Fibrobacterota bacterium]